MLFRSLADIPGLGAKRVSELLKHFGSVARLRSATVEQITEVKGIGSSLAQLIVDGLRKP